MESIGDVKVNNNTQYWIYLINEKSWEKLLTYVEETEIPYIMSFKNSNVLEGDIIYVYVTKSTHNGFAAIIQAHKDLRPNKKIKIFKDDVANQYCVKIKVFTLLQKTFSLGNVSRYFQEDPAFKSAGSFRSKYLRGDLMFVKIPSSIGNKMVIGLYELSDNYEDSSIQEESEKKQIEQDKKEKKKKKKVCVVRKHSDTSDECSAKDFDIIENDSDSCCDSTEFVSFEKNESDSEKCQLATPMIPILFDPCNNFRWYNECKGDKDFIKEFKKHYTKCEECQCTNNNDKDINAYLDKCDIEFEIACDGDSEFNKLFSAYEYAQGYNIDKKDDNFIQLFLIDKKSHSYDRTIVIEWGIKISKYTKAHVKNTKKNN